MTVCRFIEPQAAPARWPLVAAILISMAVPGVALASSSEWYMHTGGVSHHFVETEAQGRAWNQNHAGFGLEYRPATESKWSTRWVAGLMRDSRGFASGYAGAAYLGELGDTRYTSTAIGLGLYGFYRSSSWDGQMTFVPAIVPTLSVGLFKNKVGLSILAIPKVSLFGATTTPLVFAQISFRFN